MPTVRGLFNGNIVYEIPIYQRAYVWNKADQWEPLWLDVVGIADALDKDTKPHFLGATVLKEAKSGSVEKAKQYSVVDGQQRLTTIQLLLAAVANVFRRKEGLSEKLEDLSETADGLTTNRTSKGKLKSDPDKIKPLGRDFQTFTEVMGASRDGTLIQDGNGSIGNCYRFFLGKVTCWLEGYEDPGELEERAKALLTAISDKLHVVAIYLADFENEYAIFEALNARGEPLSEWEKTKNYILFKAGETSGIDQEELYEQYLMKFDDPQWMVETGSGAGRRRRSDLFLDYWLESKLHKQIDTRRVFREFRTEIESGKIDLESWCDELGEDGTYFMKWATIMKWETTEAWDGDVETIFHSRRESLGIGAVWPYLLALSRTEMSCDDKNRCFRALDSFLWRRAIVGMTTNGYDSVAIELLRALPDEPSGETPYSDAIIEYLIAREDERDLWPSDSEVRQAVLERPLYKKLRNQKSVRRLLEAIQRAMLRCRRAGDKIMSDGLPIEHIMPQRRDAEHWPLPADAAEDAEEMRERIIIHRLGNLTLVDPILNSGMGNNPWTVKRQELHKEDNLYINKDLLNHAPEDHWDEEQIRMRGERLADYIVKIWPRGHYVTGEIEQVKQV